jgi:hypothetical protein
MPDILLYPGSPGQPNHMFASTVVYAEFTPQEHPGDTARPGGFGFPTDAKDAAMIADAVRALPHTGFS